ncbi:MAG TPA: hypothetical protein VKB88_03290 [Bryobacteraceae bacterium]|nr:hypothetical protein [Bryobacteraceae bacterium]
MTLADLRRLSIRRQIRIRFPIRNGMECIVNEHGIAQVPGLRSIPDFNLEQELASAAAFTLEPIAAAPAKPQSASREDLDQIISAAGQPAASHEHEEE